MNGNNKRRVVTTASASTATTADAAAADHSRIESLLFDSPPADCSEYTNTD